MMQSAIVESIELKNFTAFKHLALNFSPGVNLFIATHSYVVLKEFDLQRTEDNNVQSTIFHVVGDSEYHSNLRFRALPSARALAWLHVSVDLWGHLD